ncbi:hypothetical protein D3C81_1812580 [compost metagenome]
MGLPATDDVAFDGREVYAAVIAQLPQDRHGRCGGHHVRAAPLPETEAAVRVLQRGQPAADRLAGPWLAIEGARCKAPIGATHLGTTAGHVHDPWLVGHLAAFDPAQGRIALLRRQASAEHCGRSGQNVGGGVCPAVGIAALGHG